MEKSYLEEFNQGCQISNQNLALLIEKSAVIEINHFPRFIPRRICKLRISVDLKLLALKIIDETKL